MDVKYESDDDSLESNLANDVLSKLRRLKIQESIITASINKSCFIQNNYNLDSTQCPGWKVYSSKLKKSVIEIKNSFEEIKNTTSDSNNHIKDVDIEEVRKDVINLDSKMKSLEDFIDSELFTLKVNEEELMKQLNEESKLENRSNNKVKIKTKPYNAVVPSPIRVLINSPLKCPEVQKFQEFMSASKNRYGGWNEYNHNIFVQIWNKFYAADDVTVLEKHMQDIQQNNILRQFKDEVFEKISGTNLNEISSHSKWYSEFCYLKMCQKIALEKWKDNKQKIKKRQNVKRNVPNSGNSNVKLCRKENENNRCQKRSHKGYLEDSVGVEFNTSQSSFEICNTSSQSVLQDLQVNEEIIVRSEYKLRNGFARPTKQWINRGHVRTEEVTRPIYTDIENVDKLCIPNWRLGLK